MQTTFSAVLEVIAQLIKTRWFCVISIQFDKSVFTPVLSSAILACSLSEQTSIEGS